MFAPERIAVETWPAIHALLAPAMARAGYSAAELIDQLLASEAQLWVLRNEKGGDPVAAAVSDLERTPDGLIVHVRLTGGHGMAEWIDGAVDCIRAHVRAVGATGARLEGRDGWERVLASKGWKRRAVVMELAFEPVS